MPRRHPSFAVALATVSASSVFWTTASGAGVSEAELCFGQVPTIVGSPGQDVIGTEGPDVVVTNGAYGARTMGGDDLLCITGAVVSPAPGTYDGLPDFHAGTGSDRIDATSGESSEPDLRKFELYPGKGSDQVLAGRVPVYVNAGNDAEPDAIATGIGVDWVRAGSSDTVALGPGSDTLELRFDGENTSSGLGYDGGTGTNYLRLDLRVANVHDPWKVDNRAGRLTRNDDLIGTLQGFADFYVLVRGPLTFVGSEAADRLLVRGSNNFSLFSKWPTVARMQGGDDVLTFSGGQPESRFNGGEGADLFETGIAPDTVNNVFLDLSRGILRHTTAVGEVATWKVSKFENVSARAFGTVTVKGTSGPNYIKSNFGFDTSDRAIFDGKAGNDTLVGNEGDDVLIGGPGQDITRGGSGIDRCEAETSVHCEL